MAEEVMTQILEAPMTSVPEGFDTSLPLNATYQEPVMTPLPADFDPNAPLNISLQYPEADSAVVSSGPAEDLVQNNQNTIDQYYKDTATPAERPQLQTSEQLTPEEQEFLGEDTELTPDELQVQQLKKEQDEYWNIIMNDLATAADKSDAATRVQINAIQTQFNQLEAEARNISQKRTGGLRVLGMRTGRSRYAPEIQSGIIASEQRALVENLAKLATEESIAISEAQQAQLERDFQLMTTKIGLVQDIRKEKRDDMKELQAKIEEQKEVQQKLEEEADIIEVIQSRGEYDPAKIHAILGGKVALEDIQAVTNVYKAEKDAMDLSVTTAMQTGGATPDEIAIMQNSNLSFAIRKKAADNVIGRLAYEDRALSRRKTNMEIENIQSQIDDRKAAALERIAKRKADKEEGEEDIRKDAETAVDALAKVTDILKAGQKDVFFGGSVLSKGTGLSTLVSGEVLGTEVYNFESDVKQLKDLLTLDNLGLMSGVLSETDIQILANAATNLKLGMSEEKFVGELNTIKRNLMYSIKGAARKDYVNMEEFAYAVGFDAEEVEELKAAGLLEDMLLEK